MQTATLTIPKGGLADLHNQVTFQVLMDATYYGLEALMLEEHGVILHKDRCHLITTITAYNKTLYDDPQGEPNAKAIVTPNHYDGIHYFGVFASGPLKGKTNPFEKGLTETSLDGGILIFNIDPSDKEYVISAQANGVQFSTKNFQCHANVSGSAPFLNLSPPNSPSALKAKISGK